MIKRIKATAAILGLALTFLGIYGCGEGTVNVNVNLNTNPQADKSAAEGSAGNEPVTVEQPDAADIEAKTEYKTSEEDNTGADDDNRYAELYIDKINELKSDGLADQFAIADIDADDNPELIASDSKGSFDHDNAFIFTIINDEVVQLVSVIAGVDGGSLDYSHGNNLIHVSGAAAGMRDMFYEIKDGKLEEVFTAVATSMDENAEYLVNGSVVDEKEYYSQINSFMEKYNPLTRIACDGLLNINYIYEDGYGYFEQNKSEKYDHFDDVPKLSK